MDFIQDGSGTQSAQFTDLEAQLTPAELRKLTDENELENVTKLDISVDTESVTLSELYLHLPNLVELKFDTPTYIPTLRKLGTLKNLKVLWACAVGLENIDGTSGFPNLVELYISYNQVHDLSPLTFLPNLEVLDLESNQIESGLELRYLSFCPNLQNVQMRGCPISSLPDYRKIVLRRMPPNTLLDDKNGNYPSEIEEEIGNSIITHEDTLLLKELVADGLLNQEELLENEPVSRPFTAMGLRPKTTAFTPFNRPSSAFRRPRAERVASATDRRKIESNESSLTTGNPLQGSLNGIIRKTGSEIKNRKQMKSDLEEKLKNWSHVTNQSESEINILKLDTETDIDKITIPARSSLAKNIRNNEPEVIDTVASGEAFEGEIEDDEEAEENLGDTEEPELTESHFQLREPKIIRKVSNTSLSSSGYHSVTPEKGKQLNALKGVRRPIKIKSQIDLNETRRTPISSRQETLLAETREYKQVIGSLPIIPSLVVSSGSNQNNQRNVQTQN
jgi:hypothetical protein